MIGIAGCQAAGPLIESAVRDGWPLEAEKITYPVRIVWGTADKLLPWPRGRRAIPQQATSRRLLLLDRIGHCPQLDVPTEAAQLILALTF